jgi:hypothetical protein
MAVGDVAADIQSIADDDYLDIQPASGTELVVHNISAPGAAELHRYDGTNDILIQTIESGGWFRQAFHCTNAERYRVRNINGGAMLIGYDGIITKQ